MTNAFRFDNGVCNQFRPVGTALPIFAAVAIALGACNGTDDRPAIQHFAAGNGDRPATEHFRDGDDDRPAIEHFAAKPASINLGDSAVLRWTVEDAVRIFIDHGVGEVTSRRSALVRPAASTTYTLTASNAHGVSTAKTTVTVNGQNALHLSVEAQASTATAGEPIAIAVSALDATGQVFTAYAGTIHFASDDAAAQLAADYTFTAADAGTHTFSATLKTAGSHTVTAADTLTPTITGTSQSIAVTAAAATQLVLAATSPSATAGLAVPVRVTLLDAYNNIATGYTGTVHFSSSDVQAVLPADYQFVTTDAGAHSFNVTFKTAGSQTVSATDTLTPTIAGTSQSISVSSNAATQLLLSTIASTTTAGIPLPVTVTLLDAYNNLASGYAGKVHFSSTDGNAALPADYTFVIGDSGQHAFNFTFYTSGAQTLTVTDTVTASLRSTSNSSTVFAGAASKLVLSTLASPAIAGQALPLTVTAEDNFGNVATGYRGTVHFTQTDGASPPTDYAFLSSDAGTHSFNIIFLAAGLQTASVTDTANGALTATTNPVIVNAGPSDHILVTATPSISTAGNVITVVATVKDTLNNTATGYTGTVHFSSSDVQASLPADYQFVVGDAGTHSFSVTLKTAGSQTVTATDTRLSTIVGASAAVTVSPSAAQTLVVSTASSTIVAGAAVSYTVTAKDQFGNTATAYSGTVHVNSSDVQAVLPADYQFVTTDAGVHSFSVMLKTAGNQTVTATDTVTSSITGTSGAVTVSPAATQTLTMSTASATVTAGTPISYAVTAKDPFGNTATGYVGTIRFTSGDGQADLPADYRFVNTDAGAHSFNVTFKTAGSQTVTATDTATSTITGTSTAVTVSPAAAQMLTVSTASTAVTAGTTIPYAVTAIDSFGNTATSYAGMVHFSSSDGLAVLPVDYQFVVGDAGIHSFGVTLNTAGNQTVTATDTVTSTITGTSGAVIVSPATAVATFNATGSMATARYSHTATLLPGGQVLVAGGWSDIASAELYDPVAGTFTATGSMLEGRSSHTATLLPSGQVLIAGGSGTSGYLASAELYDPVAGTFTATGSMTTPRGNHSATLLPNGQVLIAGGYGNGYLASAELYDPVAGTFTATGNLLGRRSSHTATLVPNGEVLVAGGVTSSGDLVIELGSAELYDPIAGTFMATGSLATARASHTATPLSSGKALIVGGEGRLGFSTLIIDSTELYDPVAGTFNATGSLAIARYSHTATRLPGDKVLIAGGSGSSGDLASAELYDPIAGMFTAAGTMTTGRYSHTATLLPSGKVLIAGGIGDLGLPLATAELY